MPDDSKDKGKEKKCSGGFLCSCIECGAKKRKEKEQKDLEGKVGKAIIG